MKYTSSKNDYLLCVIHYSGARWTESTNFTKPLHQLTKCFIFLLKTIS